MYNIRLGLFETNSSSTHTIVIMKKEDFQRWRKSSNEEPNDETLYFIKHTDGNKSSVTFITEKQVKDDLFANISWIKDKYMKALEENDVYKAKEMISLWATQRLRAYPFGWVGDVAYEEFDDNVAVSIYIEDT